MISRAIWSLSHSRTNMSFVADHGVEEDHRIYVYFCNERNVSKAGMKT